MMYKKIFLLSFVWMIFPVGLLGDFVQVNGQTKSGLLASDVLKARAPAKKVHAHKWVIIIGGPGVGKTSVIRELAARGYPVVSEAAMSVIQEHQAQGCMEPWFIKDFQTQISLLHAERELDVERKKYPLVFFDRGPVDSLSYMLFYQSIYQPRLVQLVDDVLLRQMYDMEVFFLEPLSIHEKSEIRHEEAEEAQKLADKFIEDYKSLGFKIIGVPNMSIKDRADFILSHVLA